MGGIALRILAARPGGRCYAAGVRRPFAIVRAIALLGPGAMLGCGSSGASSPALPDAESDAMAFDAAAGCSCVACPCESPSNDAATIHVGDGLDAGAVDVASESDTAFVFVDAACVGDALAPQMGGAFLCGSNVCFSGSQYCVRTSGGMQLSPGDPPPPGLPDGGFGYCPGCTCSPLPCGCGAAPACGCLGPAAVQPSGGSISCSADEAGDLLVELNLP